jgi:hypothetical protein
MADEGFAPADTSILYTKYRNMQCTSGYNDSWALKGLLTSAVVITMVITTVITKIVFHISVAKFWRRDECKYVMLSNLFVYNYLTFYIKCIY